MDASKEKLCKNCKWVYTATNLHYFIHKCSCPFVNIFTKKMQPDAYYIKYNIGQDGCNGDFYENKINQCSS
jgi:hypothetical protein